jgi:hypothetical protein
MNRRCLLALLLTVCVSAHAQLPEFRGINYRDLVASPALGKRNMEFRAFLLGIGSVIRVEYVCSMDDEQVLKDADRMIDRLVDFSKTGFGQLYLEGVTGIGGIHYDSNSGDVLLRMLTQHSTL